MAPARCCTNCDSANCAQGVELRDAFIAQARAWHGDPPISHVTGLSPPFRDRSFDVVASFDVFEHIPDSDAHLREVARVLEAGWSYVLQTPNRWTNVVFETIRWRSFTAWREEHCSLHTLAELEARLRRHGFDTVRPHDIPVVNEFFRAKVRLRRPAWQPGAQRRESRSLSSALPYEPVDVQATLGPASMTRRLRPNACSSCSPSW